MSSEYREKKEAVWRRWFSGCWCSLTVGILLGNFVTLLVWVAKVAIMWQGGKGQPAWFGLSD